MRFSLLLGGALALTACSGSEPDGKNIQAAPRAFAACTACHSAEQQGSRRTGPNLYGVMDRQAGTLAEFRYSPAMQASGLIWTAENLDRFLAAPQQVIPGSRMVQSVPDAATRAEIIAYLAGQTSRD